MMSLLLIIRHVYENVCVCVSVFACDYVSISTYIQYVLKCVWRISLNPKVGQKWKRASYHDL